MPSCYLERQILDYFTIKNRPQASTNEGFAHTLAYAILYRRGILESFIERIDAIISPNTSAIETPPATTETTKDKINAHMSRLAQNQAYGLPEWDLLKLVVEGVKSQYSPDSSKHVTKLYYAVKDLFTLDYHAVCEVTGIDEKARTITIVWSRRYANRVGPPEKEPPITVPDERGLFSRLYAGKSLEQLNQNPQSYKRIKLDKYAKERSLEKSPEEQEDGSYKFYDWVTETITNGENAIEQKIDSLFKPVIDSEWDRITFEQFVEQYKPAPAPSIQPAPTTSIPPATDEPLTFGDFLTVEGKEVLPALIREYANRRPRYIAYMLFALSDLGLILKYAFDDKTALHSALENSLGKIGIRSALNDALIRLDAPTKKHRSDMQIEKAKIAAMIQV